MATLETMAAGLPMIVTDIPAFAEMPQDGLHCLKCPPRDTIGLTERILRLGIAGRLARAPAGAPTASPAPPPARRPPRPPPPRRRGVHPADGLNGVIETPPDKMMGAPLTGTMSMGSGLDF